MFAYLLRHKSVGMTYTKEYDRSSCGLFRRFLLGRLATLSIYLRPAGHVVLSDSRPPSRGWSSKKQKSIALSTYEAEII